MQDSQNPEDRPFWRSVGRGLRRRCPNCGTGALFSGYLSVNDCCADCGQELHHQRADDGPAYLTIVITGKLMTALMYAVFVAWRPDPLWLALGFSVGSVAFALYLLPRLKGAMINIEWAKRMHGFGQAS